MAPFKLKFRMGSSRSGSQETETEPSSGYGNTIEQPLLANANIPNTTYDKHDNNLRVDSELSSFGLIIGSNDQRNLLPNNHSTIRDQTGYINPTLTEHLTEACSIVIPQNPPPSYEHVLEEYRLARLDKDNNPALGLISFSASSISSNTPKSGSSLNNHQRQLSNISQINLNEQLLANKFIETPVFSYSTMSTPSQEDLLQNIDGSCDQLFTADSEEQLDIDINDGEYDGDTHSNMDDGCGQHSNSNMATENNNIPYFPEYDRENNSDEEDDWDSHEHQYDDFDIQQSDTIINNKSTKEIYKAVAKEWGITCKMSEQCRCMECQSNYFDCEYEENEHQKTDGGLGAGTPMFISEVMHGSACTIL